MTDETKTTRVWLVRHAPTAANRAGMFQGQRDIPALVLDDGLVSGLPHNGPRRVFSSPLSRALTAAEVLFPGEPVTTDDLLLERSVGEWEGLSHEGYAPAGPSTSWTD